LVVVHATDVMRVSQMLRCNIEEAETGFGEWLRIQSLNFTESNFKLVLRRDECVDVLGDDAEQGARDSVVG
jgi:hypothetical protein